MSVVVVTPAEPIVTLDEVKAHLRIDSADEDVLLAIYVAAATANIDGPAGWLGRAIGVQTLELRLDSFYAEDWALGRGRYAWHCDAWSWNRWPFARIRLPYPPLIDIVSITYEDAEGDDQVLTSDGWKVTDEGVEPSFGTAWPSGRIDADAVRIRYRAGYVVDPTANPVVAAPPSAIKAAVLLMVADLYANREAQMINTGRGSATENPTVAALLAPYRVLTA